MSNESFRLPDGRTVQVWVGGAESVRTVVFFHGCPDTRRAAWSGATAATMLGIRLVAFNRPGYGRSSEFPSDHATVADDAVAVADRLGVDRFAVLGMSVGGPYALACAARHPRRVTAAAAVAAPGMTVEMTPPWHRDDLDQEQQRFFARLAEVSVPQARELMRPDYQEFVSAVAPDDPDDEALALRWRGVLPPDDARLLEPLSDGEVAASAREALSNTFGYLQDAALTFRQWAVDVAEVRCPTRLWYGRRDDNAPIRNGEWFAERIAGSRLVVRDTSHLATLVTGWPEILGWLQPSA